MNLTRYPSSSGFTLIELLVVTLIAGILAAIAAPNILGILNFERLNRSNNQVYQALRQAQSNAKRDKLTWQASFRQQGNVPQWAVHPGNLPLDNAASYDALNWDDLSEVIRFDSDDTTVNRVTGSSIWLVRYDSIGALEDDSIGALEDGIDGQARITLELTNNPNLKRCVIISTLLGATRFERDSGCD